MGAGKGKSHRIKAVGMDTNVKKCPKPKFNLNDKVIVDLGGRGPFTRFIEEIIYNKGLNAYYYRIAGSDYYEDEVVPVKHASPNHQNKNFNNYLHKIAIFQYRAEQDYNPVPSHNMKKFDDKKSRIIGIAYDCILRDVVFRLHFDTTDKENRKIRKISFSQRDLRAPSPPAPGTEELDNILPF